MKNKIQKRYLAIIRRYTDTITTNQDSESRLRNAFIEWFDKDQDREAKEQALTEVLSLKVQDSHYMSPAKVDEMLARMGFDIADDDTTTAPAGMRPMRTHRVWWAVAAAVVPLLIMAGMWWYIKDDRQVVSPNFEAVLMVERGEVKQQMLQDSTVVTINSDSKLIVVQGTNERVAQLTGESYFSVKRDEQRPFIVKTQDLTIKVVGTEFNVEAYPQSDMEVVTLEQGKVQILTPDNTLFVLEPNDQFVYTRATQQGVIKRLEKTQTQEVAKWKEGMIVFNNVSLREAFRIIERHYGIAVDAGQGAYLEDTILSTFYGNTPVEDVMDCIKIANPELRYTITNGQLIVTQKGHNEPEK